MSRILRSLPLAVALFAATPAAAQILDDPRALGMGGAVRADPVGNTAVLYNPAGMSRAYMYSLEGGYLRAGDDRNLLSVNIVDSKTQPALAVGLAYGFEFSDAGTDEGQLGHDVRLAMSTPLVQDVLNLGVGLNYLRYQRDGGEDLSDFTLDVGALISLDRSFHIGLVGDNLISVDDPAFPRRAGGGVAYTGGMVVADVDVLADFDTHPEGVKPVFAAGLELLLAESVPLRIGVEHSQAVVDGETSISGGLGFVTGKGAQGTRLTLGHKQSIDDGSRFTFGLGLTFYL